MPSFFSLRIFTPPLLASISPVGGERCGFWFVEESCPDTRSLSCPLGSGASMLEVLLIIAALALAGIVACHATGCAYESAALELIKVGMNAQWLCGDVHRCGIDGLWLPDQGRWTGVSAALARPAPRSRT